MWGVTAGTVYKVYRIGATLLSLVILAAFTVFMYYLSYKHYSLFSWHPSFMTIGFSFLMAEAIILQSRHNIFSLLRFNQQQSTRQHWILNLIGVVCVTIGLITIVMHKYIHEHPHFKTWHSVFGLVALILFAISCVEGVITLYSSSTGIKHWIKPVKIKLAHVCIGVITFLAGLIAECTGIYTHFLLHVADPNVQLICVILLVITSIVVVEGALKSAYSRYRNIMMDLV